MTNLVVHNLRLKELLMVVGKNQPFFNEFSAFIGSQGYDHVSSFVAENNPAKAYEVLKNYFNSNFESCLYDGIARPYDQAKSKWFFITWLLRDAPQQRLQPIVSSLDIGTAIQNKIWLIYELMKFAAPLMPHKEQWEWPAISEVMLQRLEGSRRALKGGLFEAIVRSQLNDLFKANRLKLSVTPNEVKLNGETYDVEVVGASARILMPVKTRETMGGGHALLFTRDINKSISVAHGNGFNCIPVVIAESWAGNLDELMCDQYIYIQTNPNQVDLINPILGQKLQELLPVFLRLQ